MHSENGAHGFSLLLLSVSAYQNVGNAFSSLCLVFFYDMGIEVFCGCDACMAQLLRYRDNVGAVCQEYGGHRVTEGVGIDMRQAVTCREICKPSGKAVRIHCNYGIRSKA